MNTALQNRARRQNGALRTHLAAGLLAAVEIVLLLLSACHSRRPVLPIRGTPMPPMVASVSPAATAATPVLHTPIPARGCSSESETQPSNVSIATTAGIVTSPRTSATGAQSAHTQTTAQAATAVALIELLLEVDINQQPGVKQHYCWAPALHPTKICTRKAPIWRAGAYAFQVHSHVCFKASNSMRSMRFRV